MVEVSRRAVAPDEVLMSLAEAPEETAKGLADLKSMSAERIASLRGTDTKAKPEAKSKESAEAGKPVGGGAVEGNAKGDPSKTESPAKASETVAAADYSFVPESFRPEAEKLSKSFLAHLKDQAERDKNTTKDYHEKTTALAAERRALEVHKDLLEFGEAVKGDPEAMAALRALHAKRTGAAVPSEKQFKFTEEHTDEEWQAYFDERDRRVREEALRELEGRTSSATREQRERSEIARSVLSSLTAEGYTAEEVDKAFTNDLGDWKGVREWFAARGVAVSAENVVSTLRRFLPAKTAAAKETPKQDSPNGKDTGGRVANGASVLGRNGGVLPSVHVPKFIMDGKEPNSREERLAAALFKVNQRRVAQGQTPITND